MTCRTACTPVTAATGSWPPPSAARCTQLGCTRLEGEDAPGERAAVHVLDHGVELLHRVGLADHPVEVEQPLLVEVDDDRDVALGADPTGPAADDPAVDLGEVRDRDVVGDARCGDADLHAHAAPVEDLHR